MEKKQLRTLNQQAKADETPMSDQILFHVEQLEERIAPYVGGTF